MFFKFRMFVPVLITLAIISGMASTIPVQAAKRPTVTPTSTFTATPSPTSTPTATGTNEYQPTIHYVKRDAAGANDGTSWTNGFTDLQLALAAASSGDEIWVATGVYKPTSGTDRSVSFVLKNGVAVYGGFAGTESLRDQRDLALNPTILSGDIGILYDNSDNSYHVVVGSNTDNTTVLDNFLITGGNANAYPHDKGGGIYNDRGSPTIMAVSIERNYATFGGGMYNGDTQNGMTSQGSHPTLVNVNFISNSAVEGGGMENQFSSSPSITNAFFHDNTAVRSGGGMLNMYNSSPTLTRVDFVENRAAAGGGMANEQSSPSLTEVIFRQNSASDFGGGMTNTSYSIPELANVTFSGNTAREGGGMANFTSAPALSNVTFQANSASERGGGMYNQNNAPAFLKGVTFDANTSYDGGGLYIGNSNPVLTNVTFHANSAAHAGGGIFASSASPSLRHVTLNENTAGTGGALYNFAYDSVGSNLFIRNSILWGNIGGEIVNISRTPDVAYSIVQGGYPGTGNLDADPLLGPLQDNGGFTQTMALGASSPAIDAGDDISCPPTDQRGVARPQGNHCDMGAYEYQFSASPTPTLTHTSTPTFTFTPTSTFTPANTPTPTATSKPGRPTKTPRR